MPPESPVWFIPSCRKRRTAFGLLDRGIGATDAEQVRDAPSRSELEHVLSLLGSPAATLSHELIVGAASALGGVEKGTGSP